MIAFATDTLVTGLAGMSSARVHNAVRMSITSAAVASTFRYNDPGIRPSFGVNVVLIH
jgi:hypothetical protein